MLLGYATPQSRARGTRKNEEMHVDTRPNNDAFPCAFRSLRALAAGVPRRHAQAPGMAGKQRDRSQ